MERETKQHLHSLWAYVWSTRRTYPSPIDVQTGSVKLITSIKGIVKYLGHLGLLYKAFSVHMKHQTVPKRSLPQAIELLAELDSYLETITEKTDVA